MDPAQLMVEPDLFFDRMIDVFKKNRRRLIIP